MKITNTFPHKINIVPQKTTITAPHGEEVLEAYVHTATIPVAKVKLVLVECDTNEALIAKSTVNNKVWIKQRSSTGTPATYYKPILISESEPLEIDDAIYGTNGKIINKCNNAIVAKELGYVKIVALPEHFSQKHLELIVDGSLKDEVLIECERAITKSGSGSVYPLDHYIPALDSESHVKLHLIQEEIKSKLDILIWASNEIKALLKNVSIYSHWHQDTPEYENDYKKFVSGMIALENEIVKEREKANK